MLKKRTIIYVGPFLFPNGGAAARRILGISKTLQALDYNIMIGTGQCEIDAPLSNEYEGIEVYSLNERVAENYPGLLKYLRYLFIGKKTISWLNSLNEKPYAIILYSGYSPYFLRLLPWCKRNNIPLVFDAVEWYDPPNLIKGMLNPYYWNIELAMRFLSAKSKNIITISKYLQHFYQNKGCQTTRIPPTLDMATVSARLDANKSSVITLGYTGSPGHKDLLNNVLSALLDIDEDGLKFILNIAGITKGQLLDYPALKSKNIKVLPACIECYGVVSHSKALEIIRNADFSVLLRPNKRYAKAGFPTKFVESLAVGTPIIANYTSDLADYLIDSKTGIVCKSEHKESLKSSLERIEYLSHSQLQSMRIEARTMAETYFDINSNKDELERFFLSLK